MRNKNEKPSIFSSFPGPAKETPSTQDALLAKIWPDDSADRVHMLVRDYAKSCKKSNNDDTGFGQELAATLMLRLEDNLRIAPSFQNARNNIYYTKLALSHIGHSIDDNLSSKIRDQLTQLALTKIEDAMNMIDVVMTVSSLKGSLATINATMDETTSGEVCDAVITASERMSANCSSLHENNIVKGLTLRALAQSDASPSVLDRFKNFHQNGATPAP